jgi:hypothetical protein
MPSGEVGAQTAVGAGTTLARRSTLPRYPSPKGNRTDVRQPCRFRAASGAIVTRHLPADDARVAALLERLAPELAADAARNDVDGRFRTRTSRGCIAPG